MSPSPPADSDEELMHRAKRGDREAFGELVERWKQPVQNFVFRTLPDPDEAQDLAQAVFVQLWKSVQRYERSARFSTFLFTIARNLCLNEIRRRARHPATSLDETRTDEESSLAQSIPDTATLGADQTLQRTELFEKVESAVADLPEKQRTALVLCREGELSYEEIGAILGTSLQATKSLIHRARETLKARLKPYLDTGAWGD
ncbi:MAG TPA: sigma-70 family RNA polymerase sigma factor [Candidatus Limnocylindria bacterium]|nr:sigma-70 family RNA polymerase sigma factor [Candidatus Limnocylindria bacterium]